MSSLDARRLQVRDAFNESAELLEFKDEIALCSFKYGFLVACSQLQCFIYQESNRWTSPVTIQLREKCPQFVKQTDK